MWAFVIDTLPISIPVLLIGGGVYYDVSRLKIDVKTGFNAIAAKLDSIDISIISMNLQMTKHMAEDGKTQLKIEYLEKQVEELKEKSND